MNDYRKSIHRIKAVLVEKKNRLLLFFATVATIVLSIAYHLQENAEIAVKSIALSESTIALMIGDQISLEAIITPEDATNKEVVWESDNEAVASVTEGGIVKALEAGKATITATTVDQGKKATCSVEVKERFGTITGEATHVTCRHAELSGKATLSDTTSTSLSFGVIYSTSSNVLIDSATRIEAGVWDAEYHYTVDTEVLEPNTTYYYRSYIILSDIVKYGEVKTFKTQTLDSMIETLEASDINPKNATLNAMLDLTDCKYKTLEYGFELTSGSGQTYALKADNYAGKRFSYKDETLAKDSPYSYAAYVKLDGILYKAGAKAFTTPSIQANVAAKALDVQCQTANISGRLDILSKGSFATSALLYYSKEESTLDGLKSKGTKKSLTMNPDCSYGLDLSSLVSATKYHFVVVAKVDDVEVVSSVGNFTTLPTGAVDLGLSVIWASCNLGASKPSQYGAYYQWGGTRDVSDTKIYLSFNNCPYKNPSREYYIGWYKYTSAGKKTVLEAKDDAASVALGGKWRMPTYTEWKELQDSVNCSWTNTTLNGVKGYKVQSKKAGYTNNWIFLPAAGIRHGNELSATGVYLFCWSSSLYLAYDPYAYILKMPPHSGALYGDIEDRFRALPVRPVYDK